MHRNSPCGVTHTGLADLPSKGSAFPNRELCGIYAGSTPVRGASNLSMRTLGEMSTALRVAGRFAHAQVRVPVPIIAQSSDFSCGSANLLSVLHYWLGESLGPIETEADLWKGLRMNTESGAEPERITAVARRLGLEANLRENMSMDDLRAALDFAFTVILCIQAWQETPAPWATDWDHGHYVTAVDMDAAKVTFMDPSIHTSYGWMPRGELPTRWHSPDFQNRPKYGLGIVISGKEAKGPFPSLPRRML